MLTPIEILALLQESMFKVVVDEQVNEVLFQSMQIHFPYLFDLTYETGLHYIDYSRCITAKVNILTELLQQNKVFYCSSNYIEGDFKPDFAYSEESVKNSLNLIEIKCRISEIPYRDLDIIDWVKKYNIIENDNRILHIDYTNIKCDSKYNVNEHEQFDNLIKSGKVVIDTNKNNMNINSFDKINKAVKVLKILK